MDLSRMAKALSIPGIDPRTWITVGIVTAITVDAVGVHCDITTLDGLEEHATVSPGYAGPGFGFHLPLKIGHAVVILVPEGDWMAGARIVGQAWDAGDPPPSEVVDHPDDVLLFIETGKAIRIIVSGGGDAVIEARDDSKVRLGSEQAIDAVIKGTTYRVAEDSYFAAIESMIALLIAFPAFTAFVATIVSPPAPISGAAILTAYANAVAAFHLNADGYLAPKVVV